MKLGIVYDGLPSPNSEEGAHAGGDEVPQEKLFDGVYVPSSLAFRRAGRNN
ncbi:hypothetical protein HS1genome_2062 [Sulfodiicoccus acidiphilus]|uniref:Uncharacterized protein n=1 Tax=Sulfodiicoccus acidiphilus TaxID=1670455 RepID=A0A348B671_9CREN|nr:hypothetical protein [Sulfodiicoccus acidiphilus]BBD73673.1 hypothetical protein HS1genome_2062 [Sulfodiicoccus acidiphilus]GGU01915.1 hypothetical protein GCM10007116_18760 [Sulfodiicoccus acidiphilus]